MDGAKKLWQLPINNEQHWSHELDVDFTEHVFLEQHLESWCPSSGPVRHFMELVCVGLSKNSYIAAKEKMNIYCGIEIILNLRNICFLIC